MTGWIVTLFLVGLGLFTSSVGGVGIGMEPERTPASRLATATALLGWLLVAAGVWCRP